MTSTSWTKGILSFSDKPLGEVIATLSRYRNGVLRCDPAVAGLRLSGTFPLKNTDAILNVIAQTLPVKNSVYYAVLDKHFTAVRKIILISIVLLPFSFDS